MAGSTTILRAIWDPKLFKPLVQKSGQLVGMVLVPEGVVCPADERGRSQRLPPMYRSQRTVG
jgi:hypothetical protein